MKIIHRKLWLLLFIFILHIGCKSEKVDNKEGVTIDYLNQISMESININAKDSVDYPWNDIKIIKKYFFDFLAENKEGHDFSINHEWSLEFVFISIKGKSIIIPYTISQTGKSLRFTKVYTKEYSSIDLITEQEGGFYFEIELCYAFFEAKKIKVMTPTSKKGEHFFGKKIHDVLLEKVDNPSDEVIKIKEKILNDRNEICRKIKVVQEDLMVIFSNLSDEALYIPMFDKFQKVEIKESGNLLDTMKIDKTIWSDYIRLYGEVENLIFNKKK